jgi:hypothetical protein
MMDLINTNHIEHIKLEEEEASSKWHLIDKKTHTDSFKNWLLGRVGKESHKAAMTDCPKKPRGSEVYSVWNPTNEKIADIGVFIKDKKIYRLAYIMVTTSSGSRHRKYFPPGTAKAEINKFIDNLKIPNQQIEI